MLRSENDKLLLLEIGAMSFRLFNENFTNLYKYAKMLAIVTSNSLKLLLEHGSRERAVNYSHQVLRRCHHSFNRELRNPQNTRSRGNSYINGIVLTLVRG